MGRFAASRLKIARASEIRKFQPAIEIPNRLQGTSPQPTTGFISVVPAARALSPSRLKARGSPPEQVAGSSHHFSSPPA
ncbi:hypothetical protein D3C72_2132150 [compost metagenome]